MSFVGAVIGCGRMGAFSNEALRSHLPDFWFPLSHCEAMAIHPEIQLSAVCDLSSESASRAQAEYNVPHRYTDYRALIDEVRPDILGVATRTPGRADIVEYAIQSGVRALHIEKPLCNQHSEFVRLQELITASRVPCTFGTLRRYFDIYHQARDLAASGRFGKLQQVEICFGRGSLLWTHAHSLDLLRFMTGDEPVSQVVAQFDDGFVTQGSVLDGDPVVASVLVTFASGVKGVIGQIGGADVILGCSGGTIVVESDGNALVCRYGVGDAPYWRKREVIEAPVARAELGGSALAMDRLVRALQGGCELQVESDRNAVLENQRLIFACAQSALENGAAVDPRYLRTDLHVTGRSGNRYA